MHPRSYLPACVAGGLLCVFALVAAAAPAKLPGELLGTWKGGTRAFELGYSHVKVSGPEVLFSGDGQTWECATGYSVSESGAMSRSVTRRFDEVALPERYVKLRLHERSTCSEATALYIGFWASLPGVLSWTEEGPTGTMRRRGHFYRTDPFSAEGVPIAGMFEAAATQLSAQQQFGKPVVPIETPQLPQIESPPPRSWGGPDVEIVLVSGYSPASTLTEVVVERPGRDVVLVLTSHDKVLWQVKVTQGTRLRGIVLGSNDKQSGVIGDASFTVHRVDLPYADRADSPGFRQIVAQLNQWLGVEKVHALRGGSPLPGRVLVRSLDAPRNELTVQGVRPVVPATIFTFDLLGADLYPLRFRNTGPSGDPRPTRASAPGPVGRGALPVAVSEVAPYGGARFGAFGGTNAVAGRSAEELWYVTQDSLKRLDLRTGEVVPIPQPTSFPTLSWATAVAYDSHQDIVIVAANGGEGFLYRYDVAKGRWIDYRSLRDIDLTSLAYDPVARRYVAWTSRGDLMSITKDGELEWTRSLRGRLQGFSTLHDAGNDTPPNLVLVPRGKLMAFVYQDPEGPARIWTYDESTGTAQLTWRRPGK